MDPVTLFFFVRQASPENSDSSALVSSNAGVLFYLLFSGEAALAGGPTPFFRPFSGEKVFVGVEASRIMLSSCQRIVRRSCGRYRAKSNTTIRSPVTAPQKAPLPTGVPTYMRLRLFADVSQDSAVNIQYVSIDEVRCA